MRISRGTGGKSNSNWPIWYCWHCGVPFGGISFYRERTFCKSFSCFNRFLSLCASCSACFRAFSAFSISAVILKSVSFRRSPSSTSKLDSLSMFSSTWDGRRSLSLSDGSSLNSEKGFSLSLHFNKLPQDSHLAFPFSGEASRDSLSKCILFIHRWKIAYFGPSFQDSAGTGTHLYMIWFWD